MFLVCVCVCMRVCQCVCVGGWVCCVCVCVWESACDAQLCNRQTDFKIMSNTDVID